jgi:zinc transporter ZupT
MAMTLHNFPEGMAVGVSFGRRDVGAATALAIGIGLQNIPERIGDCAAHQARRNDDGPRLLLGSALCGD